MLSTFVVYVEEVFRFGSVEACYRVKHTAVDYSRSDKIFAVTKQGQQRLVFVGYARRQPRDAGIPVSARNIVADSATRPQYSGEPQTSHDSGMISSRKYTVVPNAQIESMNAVKPRRVPPGLVFPNLAGWRFLVWFELDKYVDRNYEGGSDEK